MPAEQYLVLNVIAVIDTILLIAVLASQIWALVHCLLQRADAFPAAGKLTKWAWVGIIALAILFTLLFGTRGILGLVGVVAGLVYLLDVRPAVREIADGGGW